MLPINPQHPEFETCVEASYRQIRAYECFKFRLYLDFVNTIHAAETHAKRMLGSRAELLGMNAN